MRGWECGDVSPLPECSGGGAGRCEVRISCVDHQTGLQSGHLKLELRLITEGGVSAQPAAPHLEIFSFDAKPVLTQFSVTGGSHAVTQ